MATKPRGRSTKKRTFFADSLDKVGNICTSNISFFQMNVEVNFAGFRARHSQHIVHYACKDALKSQQKFKGVWTTSNVLTEDELNSIASEPMFRNNFEF